MLMQLHWENRQDLKETIFVAQGDFEDAPSCHAWAKEIIERRKDEMPDGFVPLLCDEHAPCFALSAGP